MDRVIKNIYLGDYLYSPEYDWHGSVSALNFVSKEIEVIFQLKDMKLTRIYKIADLGEKLYFQKKDIVPNLNPYHGKYSVQYFRKFREGYIPKPAKASKPVDKQRRKNRVKPSWTYLPYVVGEPHIEDHDFSYIHKRRKKI